MRKAIIALGVLTTAVLASAQLLWDPGHTDRSRNRTQGKMRVAGYNPPSASGYLVEAFNSSGNGAGTICACSAVTGTKGEALTFTRASSSSCMKGNWTTGIANGDLVTCSSNQPSISYRPNGTGPLGYVYEPARTNTTLRSQEIDDVAYGSNNSGASNPVITADYAVAPDGTTTADRLQFPATTGSNYSQRFQVNGCPATTQVLSMFIKGTSGSGTLDLYSTDGCVQCSFNSSTWTRCSTTTSTGATPAFGNVGAAACGAGSRSAADVLIWGFQCEAGGALSSYIATAGATVTRADPTFTINTSVLSTAGVTNADGCVGADIYVPAKGTLGIGCGIAGSNQASRLPYAAAANGTVRAYDGTNQNTGLTLADGSLYGTVVGLSAMWKTGVGISSWNSVSGLADLQATYAGTALGSGGASMQIGHAAAGCGVGGPNEPFHLSNLRFDKYANGCHR